MVVYPRHVPSRAVHLWDSLWVGTRGVRWPLEAPFLGEDSSAYCHEQPRLQLAWGSPRALPMSETLASRVELQIWPLHSVLAMCKLVFSFLTSDAVWTLMTLVWGRGPVGFRLLGLVCQRA